MEQTNPRQESELRRTAWPRAGGWGGAELHPGSAPHPWLLLEHQHGGAGASSQSGPQHPPPPGWDFKAKTQEGGPGRGTCAFHQDCLISGFALLEISSLEAWIAATWGFNLGWARGLVARNPKRRTINITKAGPSDSLRFSLSPHHLMFWKAREETFLSISASLYLGLSHMAES